MYLTFSALDSIFPAIITALTNLALEATLAIFAVMAIAFIATPAKGMAPKTFMNAEP